MATAALVLGIISIVMGVSGFFVGAMSLVGLVLGLVGFIIASYARRRRRKALAGFVCSIIGAIFNLVPAVLWMISLLPGIKF